MPRSGVKVFKKRKFHGNHRTNISSAEQTPGQASTSSSPRPRPTSSSSKKLQESFSYYEKDIAEKCDYTIIDLTKLEQSINKIATCKDCQSSLTISKKRISGLACEITVNCNNCDQNSDVFENCESVTFSKAGKSHKMYDLNVRLVLGLRNIGKGRIAAEKLCSVMNLDTPYARFHLYEEFLSIHAANVCKLSMSRAVLETIDQNEGSTDMAVAVDGSWQRRGHKSLNGIVSATSLITGKVVDVEILSKYCLCKERLQDRHDVDCSGNFRGSSGGMEVTGAINIFNRSLDLYTVRYTEYLGDGDTKAHAAVLESKPYGDTNIEKIECIGHVQKRMGTRLRYLKSTNKKLPDGTSLGGRGGLTDAGILQIQKYYGLAIRRNYKSVEEMKKAIWAEFFHILSSNNNPQHGLCPDSDDTWCKYRKAMRGNDTYDHTEHFHLPDRVMTFIKPVFKDLSDTRLLQKCLGGKTQNSNESLNNVIWSFVAKGTFVRLKTLKLGVYLAVSSFNEGAVILCKILEECGLTPGKNLVYGCRRVDQRRVKAAEKAQDELEKKVRQKKHLFKRKLEDKFEEEERENPSYVSGFY